MSLTTRNNLHEYGGVEHTQPGPFDDCLLCKIATLEAELVALREVNSWALRHVPDTTVSGKIGTSTDRQAQATPPSSLLAALPNEGGIRG